MNPLLQAATLTRRDLLRRSGMGFGMLGLAALLETQDLLAGSSPDAMQERRGSNPLAPRRPHFAPKARQVVHLFMNGGPSHVDTFDPKPQLDKYHGRPLSRPNLRTERKTAGAMRSPFRFQRYGKSGIPVSELFHQTASAHIDDMCIIRSMVAEVPNHEPSLMLMNCGDGRLPRPSMGAWITYGLGSENQNLPGYVVLRPSPKIVVGPALWSNSFLPAEYQATSVITSDMKVDKLVANINNLFLS